MGSSLTGIRPVIVHQRFDFMMYSIDTIVNWLSLWRFKSNGKSGVPLTIRVIVGKGWGQGPQHSKSLHSWFMHLPGIKVAMPSMAYDAKGLLLESIFGEDPVIIVEDRSLFAMVDHVPDVPYRVRFGQAEIRRQGEDITIVAVGKMVPKSLRVARRLSDISINAEVLDLRTISPVDEEAILDSVSKTKRLVVIDPGWHTGGVSAEIIAMVCEKLGSKLNENPVRITYPDSHTPMSAVLEDKYYPDDEYIFKTIREVFDKKSFANLTK